MITDAMPLFAKLQAGLYLPSSSGRCGEPISGLLKLRTELECGVIEVLAEMATAARPLRWQ